MVLMWCLVWKKMDATEGFKEALVSAEQRQRRGRPDDERLNLGRRQVE